MSGRSMPSTSGPEQFQACISEQSQLALYGPGRSSGRCHTRTKLAGNQPSPSATRPHHHSLLVASITSMTSPALKPSSWSSMVTWSQSASAQTTLPSLMSCGKRHGQPGQWSKAACHGPPHGSGHSCPLPSPSAALGRGDPDSCYRGEDRGFL